MEKHALYGHNCVLVVVIKITLFPVNAYAATTIDLSKENTIDIESSNGDYILKQSDPNVQDSYNAIRIFGGTHTITLDGINTINTAILLHDNSTVNLKLKGANKISMSQVLGIPAIGVANSSTLNISDAGDGDGLLTVWGGDDAPAIGGTATQETESWTININSGTVYAYGGGHGCGIGTVTNYKGGTININGGDVHAYGDYGGAGIGESLSTLGFPTVININAGTVYAVGSSDEDDIW